MSHEQPLQPENTHPRPIDPNVAQRAAAAPDTSVWVNASAGTGKTKVLTDRVLRLLLPKRDGQTGTPAYKILCLTFTKATANEMAQRINKTLSSWAVMPEDELSENLTKLLGFSPNSDEITAARRLFAETVDTPGGLKIMTLHGFCQSVLARFPIEAGIAPNPTALEEQDASAIMGLARDQILRQAQSEQASPLNAALYNIAQNINDEQFLSLISAMASERNQLKKILKLGVNGHYTKTCQTLGLQADQSPRDLIENACQNSAISAPILREACDILIHSTGKNDQERGAIIAQFLELPTSAKRTDIFSAYCNVFLTKDGNIRKALMIKKLAEKNPALHDALIEEAQRLHALQDKIKALTCAAFTRDLLMLGEAILDRYTALKAQKGALDFDDLIVTTLDLLQGTTTKMSAQSAASWVLYKLDSGIDHILIDEAQDTNPEQWQVIEALCADFFAGENAHEQTRTIFTVGDDKQSIYSFQRASPEEFARMKGDFEEKITKSQEKWQNIDLNISFRSTQAVLDVIDSVFSTDIMHKGVGNTPTNHLSFRRGQAGLVELWPLCEREEDQETATRDPWTPPITIRESTGGTAQLATEIAGKIKHWIDSNEELPAHNRAIQAGDVMILVRSRSALVPQLSRALKNLDIPVSGADRMVLNEQITVQDILAAASFALLPSDDLTLACLLKSPLIGMEEDTLFKIANPRDKGITLWSALRDTPKHKEITDYLQALIKAASILGPYDTLSYILQTPCPADNTSGLRAMSARLGADSLEPLEELLNTSLNFERDHTASLQQFLHWQRSGKSEIKREMEHSGGQVRIMTIHASKGLQSPIVILPDTLRTIKNPGAKADRKLLWPDKTGQDILLYSPRKETNFDTYTRLNTALEERSDEEYRRLLYVAMTRAEDRLYIGGATSKKSPIEDSWYFYIQNSLQNMEHVQTLDDGSLRFAGEQFKNPDRKADIAKKSQELPPAPAWVFTQAPKEDTPPRPLMPSRPSEPDAPAASPLAHADSYRFLRGNLTHKLLEILPEISPKAQQSVAEKFIADYGQDLTKDAQSGVVSETINILRDPEFASIFGENSMAEVPITGLLEDGRVISGQIDRLLVTNSDIWIIDYKTNRPPPTDPCKIPAIYQSQMQAYATTISKIYPNRTIHAALLWTDGPNLMPIDIDLA